jgi:hypothetical protein
MRVRLLFTCILLLSLPCAPTAQAGPPFLTDDPETVLFRHYEVYCFSTLNRTGFQSQGNAPAVEFNMGAIPNLQLHAIVPMAYYFPSSGPSGFGPGDIELGAKYRFVQETRNRPQIGTFPLIQAPSGNASRGLGNGGISAKLPLWVQKSWGKWTSYGGGGYIFNSAPGMRGSAFGGILVQRELTKKLTLGGELFVQGTTSRNSLPGTRQSSVFNAGGYYNFSPKFSLLFSVGHSVQGEAHTIAYLGLYYTWGRRRSA